MYRNRGGLKYRNVSQTIVLWKTRSDVERELGSVKFACSKLTLNQTVKVQRGDVLGACVFDPPSKSVYRLDIAGRPGSGEADSELLKAKIAHTTGCTETSVPRSINFAKIRTQQDDIRSSRVLHLSAIIST